MIFEGEPQDGTAAYVELLDPTCNVMLFVCLSGGWASFRRRAALSLSHRENSLSLQERERQLALFLTKEIEASERELLLCLRDIGREPPLGSGSRVAGPPSVVELLPLSPRENSLSLQYIDI